ncbi:MAG: ribosome maturation factor RimM [Bifidobacteriaceae bacterium]|jgi:16S rRNA processing protein RimM|nr:ribosome maturation factor RimM [Bifidobacteriaceae bacterium]
MRVVLAVIGRAHGISGDVVLDLRTDRPEERFQLGSSYEVELPGVDRPPVQRLTLRRYQAGPKRAVAGFEGIGDRTAAESLRGIRLLGEVDPFEEPDAWYPAQLRGVRVVLPDGSAVGTVTGVSSLPGQDLLKILQPDGSTALVPLVKALVPEVDLERGQIVIDPPAGLVAARPEKPAK